MHFLLLLLCLPFFLKAQNNEIIDIPDPNFKAYLLKNPYINTNKDSEIQASEAKAFRGGISVSSRGIYNLKGIEAFINLINLDCSSNNLTKIDVSKNSSLELLFCYNNQLTSLDVSKNTALEFLSCFDNKITSLDVSKNTALTWLFCYDNQLTNLNVKNGNNANMTFFNVSNNDNLTCIQVDNEKTVHPTCNMNRGGWCKGVKANYREQCKIPTSTYLDTMYSTDNDISIFPNPVIDKLTIKGPLKRVMLHSVKGEKVLETKEHTIDLSSLPNRMYFLSIEDTDNKIATKKIIKN